MATYWFTVMLRDGTILRNVGVKADTQADAYIHVEGIYPEARMVHYSGVTR